MEPIIEMALSELTDQPSGLDYSEKKVIWPETNSGKAPTWEELENKLKELQSEYEANQYQRDRADAYPSYADQFDTIYHQGIDAWKAEIKKVKDAHPKPE